MWLNKFEKDIYGPFSNFVDGNEDKELLFELVDGAVLVVKDDTGDFESDNGLDINEKGYEEYWERGFIIVKIIKDDGNIYKVNGRFCVNYHCIPKKYSIYKKEKVLINI